MSLPQAPNPPPPDAPSPDAYARFKTTTSYTLLVASPILMLLPPRKLDLYTFSLATAFVLSANHLSVERSGRSIPQRLLERPTAYLGGLPSERAKELQEQLRVERMAREREARERDIKEGREADKGFLEKVWMGGESENWKERRLQEEREALEEGRGYGDLIMEQIREVWGRGKEEAEAQKKDAEAESGTVERK
ncbi:MAG: hypothetical protein M1819_003631 [Sarea resinae]|nr:MAG: hypothetical protein M1819_003631 [Sarea resinae]